MTVNTTITGNTRASVNSFHKELDEAVAGVALAPPAGDSERLQAARELRDRCLQQGGASLSSLGVFYRALAAGALAPISIPAINLRGLTYDLARAAWRAAIRCDAGPIVFELSPSEARAGDQLFMEFAAMVVAAAVREGYRGPIFLQGDHFRVTTDDAGDIRGIAGDAIDAGMWQIDVDAADLEATAFAAGAHPCARNAAATAAATVLIREQAVVLDCPPAGAEVLVGGEVGVIGGANTTVDDMAAFMGIYCAALPPGMAGLGKISVQSGTRHGGVVLSDGSVDRMTLDVPLLRALSQVARQQFGLPGVVQHGASTLTLAQLAQLPAAGAVEVHLATALQNLIFDHPAFPGPLRDDMMAALTSQSTTDAGEAGSAEGSGDYAHTLVDGLTTAQQFYHNRWRGWGQFKRALWTMPLPARETMAATCEAWFDDLFAALCIAGRGAEMRALYPQTGASAL